MPRTRRSLARFVTPLGLLFGTAAGITLVALVGATPSGSSESSRTADRAPGVEVTHLPPLLTADDEDLDLGYDAYCLHAGADDTEADCDVSGTVYARAGDHEVFTALPLRLDRSRAEGRLTTTVPDDLRRSPLGFSYFAVIEDRATGASTTLPTGGSAAPQRALPLGRPVEIALGHHRFGATRSATARVAEAAWGAGPADVGLEQGRNLPPIGGASFDVGADGTIHVLDEANRRVLRWAAGDAEPTAIPIAIDGTIADLAVTEGRIHVLETVGSRERPSLLRTFSASGRRISEQPLAENAYRVQLGPRDAPFVLQQRSSQWVRATSEDGGQASSQAQRSSGRPGRPLAGGGEVVLLRAGNEIRIAVSGPGGTRRTWRVTSASSLAEVQLAEPVGDRLVLVARVFTESRDEFLVLVLDRHGVAARLTVPSSDWAESAPLSRFRLRGAALYQLGSTPAGLFVDRFDLEVDS